MYTRFDFADCFVLYFDCFKVGLVWFGFVYRVNFNFFNFKIQSLCCSLIFYSTLIQKSCCSIFIYIYIFNYLINLLFNYLIVLLCYCFIVRTEGSLVLNGPPYVAEAPLKAEQGRTHIDKVAKKGVRGASVWKPFGYQDP